ncbi:DUF3817 domain-containing protein [Tsukamurella sp. 8F]|uniref:DUF3817 domain-containing protein n=1 Tax=unclassified Tsukamurella TaxID=2633480 RepID=UPI0023B951EE|nr:MULTISPECIES: DUF3817 domain-containing protein [unclassified Tsukamurella]MDF0531014.1 DUF3817 domain-containing protein [Tsukamurella sp. 8J]MDF0588715.1 DUF3817 domain-containing protein [Tsukamurella sp. 8F]
MSDATATTITPEQLLERKRKRVRGALGRYRFMAYFTGVCLLVLTAEVVYKYVIVDIIAPSLPTPTWMWYIGAVHGWGYLVYLLVTVDLGLKARWKPLRFLLTLIAGTIPFASFYFEHLNTREVREQFQL